MIRDFFYDLMDWADRQNGCRRYLATVLVVGGMNATAYLIVFSLNLFDGWSYVRLLCGAAFVGISTGTLFYFAAR